MSKQVVNVLSRAETLAAPAPEATPLCCTPLDGRGLGGQQAVELARMFKALGDPVRLRLLSLIAAGEPEVCVCDLSDAFDLTGPTISYHLKALREAGLVDCERRGTWVYYWLRPDVARGLGEVLASFEVPVPA